MMQNNIKNIFVGLDTDTESKYVSPASYTDANNIRITPSTDNKETYLQNMPGNKVLDLEATYSWRDGVVVGKCKDYQYGFIYFFVCSKNTTGYIKDCIYKVDCNTDTVSVLLSSNKLFPNYRTANVLKTDINPVVSATIYDNKMFWCDGTDTTYSHPPRFLDISKAAELTALDVANIDITDMLSVTLMTPLYPLTCSVITDSVDNSFNYLNNNSYQFTYRFVYKNGATSRFAPISKLAVTGYNQIGVYPIQINLLFGDKIQYLMNGAVNTLATVIESIEFAFRENYTNDFKSFKKIPYPTAQNYASVESFFGNEAYSIVAETDYITEYDEVPLLATSCQYADTRVFWGNYKQDRFKLQVYSYNGTVLSYTKNINKQGLKPGSKYKYAIDFIDKYGKRTTSYVSGKSVLTGVDVALDINGSINTTAQNGLLSNLECKKVQLSLANIPEDISAIEVRRSNNLSVERFIQGRIEQAYYKTGTNLNNQPVFLNGPNWTTTNYTTHNYVQYPNTSVNGSSEIYFDISNWNQSGISYTYAPGDKLKLITLNKNDDIPKKTYKDALIKRQEGDILVVDTINNFDYNCVCDLRVANSNSELVAPNIAMCGDSGGIWFFIIGWDKQSKLSKANAVGWKDEYNNINFNSCCQNVFMNGGYNQYQWLVVGDGGIVLGCYWNTGTSMYEITEYQAYNAATPNYRSVITGRTNAANAFLCITGDKNSSGNATVILDYTVFNARPPILTGVSDISNTVAIKANGKKLVTCKRNDVDTVGFTVISGVTTLHYPIFINTDDNAYIGLINLSVVTVSPTGITYTNIGTSNATYWEADDLKALAKRRILSIATTQLDILNLVSNGGPILYVVGENGLFGYCNPFNTPSNPYFSISSVVVTQSLQDICVNQFKNIDTFDTTLALIVADSGYTITLATNSPFTLQPVRIFQDTTFPNTTFTSCCFGYVNGSGFSLYNFCGEKSVAAYMAQKLYTETTFGVDIIETDMPIINYGAMIEVYTPASELSDQLYYEVGYSRNLRDFDGKTGVLTANTGTLNLVLGDGGCNTVATYENVGDGDCFVVKKKFYGRLWTHAEDVIIAMTPQGDTVNAWNKDIGRPNIEDLTVNFASTSNELLIPFRNFTSNIRFSNPYIQGTKTNGLQTFELLNYKQLPIEYGAICALQVANNTNEDGTIMLSIHKRERVSIYIGKVQFTDVAGNNIISLSDQILGSYRTVSGSLGSVHTESICEYNSFIYGFDALKGVVWRYGQNGSTRISDVGMRLFFYSLGKDRINDSTKNIYQKVISEYNPYYDEVIFTFMDYQIEYPYVNNSFSIVWSERLNRWISKRDAKSVAGVPVMSHASMYQKLYSAYLGMTVSNNYVKVDKHDDSTVDTNLSYGHTTQSVCSVELVFNGSIDMVKSWNNIRLQTDELWDAGLVKNELGQQTMIIDEESELEGLSGFWRKLENNYYAPVMRDMNTLPAVSNPIFEGNPMKSQTLTVRLVLNRTRLTAKSLSNKIVKLYDAIAKFAISFR